MRPPGFAGRIQEMPKALVLFATTHGHTVRIAGQIAETLRQQGEEVDLRNVSRGDSADAGFYDAVVVGEALHMAHHQPELVEWVKANRSALSERPSAFFSVSLTAADDTDEAREATKECIDDFLEETNWTPTSTDSIAGALQYREYDVFTRTLMRLKMRAGGHTTDTSQDHEFTDWESVERFGREFAGLAEAGAGQNA